MSRQNSKIQRWLRGGVDEIDDMSEDEAGVAKPAAPAPRTSEDEPSPLSPITPLPFRSPDSERAKVQGLTRDTLELRRRQVVPPPARNTTPPAITPPEVEAVRSTIEEVLARVEKSLDSFVHAVVALPNGAQCAALGLDAASAASLALATSQIGQGIGVPADVIDVMALTLTTGDTVVCVSTGSEKYPATLRVTLSGASLGIALHRVQQAGHDISTVMEKVT